MKGELLRVVRRNVATHDHMTLDLFHLQVPNPPVGRLADARLELFGQCHEGIRRGVHVKSSSRSRAGISNSSDRSGRLRMGSFRGVVGNILTSTQERGKQKVGKSLVFFPLSCSSIREKTF